MAPGVVIAKLGSNRRAGPARDWDRHCYADTICANSTVSYPVDARLCAILRVEPFSFRNIYIRRHIECGAFGRHQTTLQRQVLPERIANEIDGVEVTILEVHRVYILPAGAK